MFPEKKKVLPDGDSGKTFIPFHAGSNVMLNLALVPLNTKESDKSLCLASASASNELPKDVYRLLNFSSILSDILQ